MNQRLKRSSLRKATGDIKEEKPQEEIKGLAKASPAFKPVKLDKEPSKEEQAKSIARSTERPYRSRSKLGRKKQ